MRPAHVLICSIICLPFGSRAQFAVGLSTGFTSDVTWEEDLRDHGAMVEWRSHEEDLFRWRASVVHSPLMTRDALSYGNRVSERFERLGLSVGLKHPLGCDHCPRGLYRGFYVFGGLAWWRRWYQCVVAVPDDHFTATDGRRITDRYGIGLAFGGEYNFHWGCPYAELQMSATTAPDDPREHVLFPAGIGVLIGFRYVWRSHRANVHRHV